MFVSYFCQNQRIKILLNYGGINTENHTLMIIKHVTLFFVWALGKRFGQIFGRQMGFGGWHKETEYCNSTAIIAVFQCCILTIIFENPYTVRINGDNMSTGSWKICDNFVFNNKRNFGRKYVFLQIGPNLHENPRLPECCLMTNQQNTLIVNNLKIRMEIRSFQFISIKQDFKNLILCLAIS